MNAKTQTMAIGAAVSVGLGAAAVLIKKAVRARHAQLQHDMTIRGMFGQGIIPGHVSDRSVLAAVCALGVLGEGGTHRSSRDGTRETWELVKNGVRYWITRRGGVVNLRVEVSESVGWDVGAVNTPDGAHVQFSAHGGTPPVWVHDTARRVAQAMVS